MFIRIALLILLTAAMPACKDLHAISSGHVGCPANVIRISNFLRGQTLDTWTAHCRGRTYYCTDRGHQVSCKRDMTLARRGGLDRTAASPGCRYDSQCKGNRICQQGQCTAPSSNTAPSQPPRKGARPRATLPRPKSPMGDFERQMGLRVGDASVYMSHLGLKVKMGAVILSVDHGSAAHRRNLKRGDVIVGVRYKSVRHADELNLLCRDLKPGQRFRITVQRKSKLYFFKMTY